MDTKERLLKRLDEIGRSLEHSGHGVALIGLGSVGRELGRLDGYSDLDFFAVVEEGFKARYIDNLDWLSTICPLAYAFQNTVDGYKLLYADGIFCEFAVFEPAELRHVPFTPGRLVWKRAGVPDQIAEPPGVGLPPARPDVEWQVGEALTNLYVGLQRFHRGEKLSAQRFIQHYAVDRVVELASRVEQEKNGFKDPFSNERRFEQRFPSTALALPRFVQGYERSPQSALAVLEFLEANFEVNQVMARAVRDLAGQAEG